MRKIRILKLCMILFAILILSIVNNRFYSSAEAISRSDKGLSKKGILTFQVAQNDELPKRPPTMVKPEGEFSLAPQDGKLDIQKDIQIKVPQPPVTEPVPDLEDTGKMSGN